MIIWTDVSNIDSNGALNEAIYALPTVSNRLQYIMSEVNGNGREDALYSLEDIQKDLELRIVCFSIGSGLIMKKTTASLSVYPVK